MRGRSRIINDRGLGGRACEAWSEGFAKLVSWRYPRVGGTGAVAALSLWPALRSLVRVAAEAQVGIASPLIGPCPVRSHCCHEALATAKIYLSATFPYLRRDRHLYFCPDLSISAHCNPTRRATNLLSHADGGARLRPRSPLLAREGVARVPGLRLCRTPTRFPSPHCVPDGTQEG